MGSPWLGRSGGRAVDKLRPACEDAAFRDRRIGMIRHDHSQCSDRLPVTQPVYPPAPCPPGNFFQTSRRSLTARADRPAGAFAFSAEVAAGHLWRRPPGCGLPPPPTASAPRSNCRSGPRYTARTYPCQRFTPTLDPLLRAAAHDSGPRVAHPSTYASFIHNTLPVVLPAHRRRKMILNRTRARREGREPLSHTPRAVREFDSVRPPALQARE